MAAGNGRPASQLMDLAKAVAAAGIRTVVYNYRGIGASDGSLDGLTLVDYGNDVWAIADALGVQKVHLAGKTYGNRVMRAASQTRPGRVATIILVGAGGEVLPSPETIELYKRYLDPNVPKSEWLSLQAELMYAPGNERLAEKDAGEGEFPAVAASQVKASEATPKEAWSMGGTAPMLAHLPSRPRRRAGERLQHCQDAPEHLARGTARLRPQHDQRAARRTTPADRRFHSGSVRRERVAARCSRADLFLNAGKLLRAGSDARLQTIVRYTADLSSAARPSLHAAPPLRTARWRRS
jgi:pimeloyl-ACP methyl ester carboxylesterase